MIYTRRKFLAGGSLVAGAAIAGVGPSAYALPTDSLAELPDELANAHFRRLIGIAVDAATEAGASYVDARLTYTLYSRSSRVLGFGVRSLVDGYWGFASGPVTGESEVASLARSSVFNAVANSMGQPYPTELAPLTDPVDGEWIMPVRDDPFVMPEEEIDDFEGGLSLFIGRLKYVSGRDIQMMFFRQDKHFGSSLGQFTSQRIYRTAATVVFRLTNPETGREAEASIETLTPAGMGFEYIRDQPLREYILAAHEEAMEDLSMPVVPVDVGRYSMLVNSAGIHRMMNGGIGLATQIDRALGYEANSSGTSYITDPENMVDRFEIGSSLLNVECGRSEAGSVGRVRWDDEGVEPADFTLIRNGVLVNMQTSREGASWIKSHYEKSKTPYRSFGCTSASSAIDVPLIHGSDMKLVPTGNSSSTIDTLRADMDNGIEFKTPNVSMDFQQITGMVSGKAYLVKKGKRESLIANAGVLFRTPELWKSMIATGGEKSVTRFGVVHSRGEPSQSGYFSVSAPPALFREMSVIDISRKA